MRLSKRVERLEATNRPNQGAQPEPVDAEFEEYLHFITSDEFVWQIMEKFETLLATMRDNHAAIVKSDCNMIVEKGGYLGCLVTELFMEMLLASLEGRYTGPLTLPGEVIEAYQREPFTAEAFNQGAAFNLGGMNCEECGYIVPTSERFGFKRISHDKRDYSNLRCPLCGGLASIFRYLPTEPSKLEFSYNNGRIHRRDVMWIIGTVRKQDAAGS
jgi:hypothetical protein